MARSVLVPNKWAVRIPNRSDEFFYIDVPTANTEAAATKAVSKELLQFGIPYGAIMGFSQQEGSRPGAESLESVVYKAAQKPSTKDKSWQDTVAADLGAVGEFFTAGSRPRKRDEGTVVGGAFQPVQGRTPSPLDFGAGRGEESSSFTGATGRVTDERTGRTETSGKPLDADTIKKLAGIGEKAASGRFDQFLTDAQKGAGIGADRPKTFDPAPSRFSPNELRDIYLQTEGGLEDTGAGLTDEQKIIFEQNAPPSGFSPSAPSARGGATSFGESLGIDEIIGMFVEGGQFGGPISTDELGVETLNPLLEQLLGQADNQNGRVSFEQIADIEARSREQVAEFNKTAAIEIARQNNLSDVEVARLTSEADTAIAEARLSSDQYVASREGMAAEEVARLQGEAMEAAALSQAGGVTGAASEARLGQEAAAQAAAGAASPFGFMQQGGTDTDLASIYAQLNEVGLADAAARQSQADAANLAARNNAFSFAAGQEQFNPNQIAQIAANSPAALAAQGQEAAARAGATGFGALLSGDTGVNQQANEILRAQAANNPYAMQQLGQGWAGTGAADQNLRIDQILRGGLTPEQRIAEINASQAGQNFANQLNFMSNPSAVGFATEQGLFGGGNNQVLQDINNSPEGNVPGSYLGLFNSPSAAGAGGGQTTNTGNFNPTANTLRNASDEQIGFLQGAASAGGQTPSEFEQEVQSFTPQGV